MSWLQKLLPPKIKRGDTSARNKSIPEGLWSKCDGCESVLYRSDLEGNLSVCPKCGHHHRVGARRRLDLMLDAEGRVEIGAEATPGARRSGRSFNITSRVPVKVILPRCTFCGNMRCACASE